jgi:DNA-binding transcriptional MerR regulator
VLQKYYNESTLADKARRLGVLWGDVNASLALIRQINDGAVGLPKRLEGIQAAREAKSDPARTALLELVRVEKDQDLLVESIRALGEIGSPEPSTADAVLQRWKDYSAATRRAASVDASVSTMTQEGILDEAGVSESLIRELQEFGIVQPDRRDGRMVYDETDLEIVRAAAELSRFGVAGRNLRVFRSSADREAALLQQIVGPALRSRSQARRKEAIENLESLAAVCGHLKHLMLVRDLRRIKGD